MGRSAAKVVQLNRRRKRSPEMTELFAIERFDRNELSLSEINRLRNWIDTAGMPTVARELGLTDAVVWKACAGFGHRLMPRTAQVLREYLRG